MDMDSQNQIMMASPRISVGSEATLYGGATNDSQATLVARRTTLSSGSSTPSMSSMQTPRPKSTSQLPLCTHMTMTRIFTNDFHCTICGCPPTNGWLWRCTQDTELLLEDDEDKGIVDKLDALDDIFERACKPGKRSPSARQSPLSFFDETDDKQLAEYTPEQLRLILTQRRKVLDVARKANLGDLPRPRTSSFIPRQATFGQTPVSYHRTAIIGIPSLPYSSPSQKPWLPLMAGECQAKWCHTCKPHGLERSWMSLNGIADGDLPRTAVHGLSFKLAKERTVSDVKHVLNLGLRPNPPDSGKIFNTTYRIRRRYLGPSRSPATTYLQGLGITASHSSPSLTSQVTTSPPAKPTGTIYTASVVSKIASTSYPVLISETPDRLTPLSPTNGSFPPAIPYPPTPNLIRRHSADDLARLSVVIDIPLPEQTEEEIESISRPCTPSPEEESQATNGTNSYMQGGKENEIIQPAFPPTNMEEEEASNGEGIGAFSLESLNVDGGVASMEESLEEHIPDVMTQY